MGDHRRNERVPVEPLPNTEEEVQPQFHHPLDLAYRSMPDRQRYLKSVVHRRDFDDDDVGAGDDPEYNLR